MSNEDNDQDGDDLFDTAGSEESSLTSKNTEEEEGDQGETESSEDSGGEGSEETLNLDDKTSKDEEKKKQINAWFRKIQDGKTTLEDLPKHQRWLRPFLEEKLELAVKKTAKKEEIGLSELVKEELRKERDAERFGALKSSLNQTALTGDQKAELESEYKDLRSAGLDKATALGKALKIASVDVVPDRRHNMIPPRTSTKNVKDDVNEDNWREKLSEKERLAKLIEKTDPSTAKALKFK